MKPPSLRQIPVLYMVLENVFVNKIVLYKTVSMYNYGQKFLYIKYPIFCEHSLLLSEFFTQVLLFIAVMIVIIAL